MMLGGQRRSRSAAAFTASIEVERDPRPFRSSDHIPWNAIRISTAIIRAAISAAAATATAAASIFDNADRPRVRQIT